MSESESEDKTQAWKERWGVISPLLSGLSLGSMVMHAIGLLQGDPEEPPRVPAATELWRRPIASLSARDRAETARWRRAVMAEHGAWLREVRERRLRRARALLDGGASC